LIKLLRFAPFQAFFSLNWINNLVYCMGRHR